MLFNVECVNYNDFMQFFGKFANKGFPDGPQAYEKHKLFLAEDTQLCHKSEKYYCKKQLGLVCDKSSRFRLQ